MQQIIPFDYKGNTVRTVMRDGETWWVLVDVCAVLGIRNTAQTAARLDEDERSMLNIGRQGSAYIINESGLYTVLLRSDKQEAKPFKRWVTHEVLPSIRRTGRYETPAANKKLVCDIPGNSEAQEIIHEMDQMASTVSTLLVMLNTRRSEDDAKVYLETLVGVCGRLLVQSSILRNKDYKLVEISE